MRTQQFHSILDSDVATGIFEYLRNNISWEESIQSRYQGDTRLGKCLNQGDDQVVDNVVVYVLSKLGLTSTFQGIYLNYYRNGNDFCPNHTHPDSRQCVISLGCRRIFMVGKKEYYVNNGDVMVFGSSSHGIPKEPGLIGERIAIAVFFNKQ